MEGNHERLHQTTPIRRESDRYYCGIDLHARFTYICILDNQGNIVYHKNRPCTPENFLKTIAPFREGIVIGVECIFCWYWLADLCEAQGIDFILGHALYMRAIHGVKTKNDRIDSLKIRAQGTHPEASRLWPFHTGGTDHLA